MTFCFLPLTLESIPIYFFWLRSYRGYLTIDDILFILLIAQLTMIFNPLTLHFLFSEMRKQRHRSWWMIIFTNLYLWIAQFPQKLNNWGHIFYSSYCAVNNYIDIPIPIPLFYERCSFSYCMIIKFYLLWALIKHKVKMRIVQVFFIE